MLQNLLRTTRWIRESFATQPEGNSLSLLRIILGVLSLGKLLMIYPARGLLFGRNGLYKQAFYGENALASAEPTIWSVYDVLRIPLPDDFYLTAIFVVHALALILLIIGWCPRVSAFLSLVFHWFLGNSNPYILYGFDRILTIFLFYFVLIPSRGNRVEQKFALNVLRIHLCWSYLISGLDKINSKEWQMGESIWRAFLLPEYNNPSFDVSRFPALAFIISGWIVIFLEVLQPLIMGFRRSRFLGFFLFVGLHAGIFLFQGLYFFSMLMMALSFCLFLLPDYGETIALQAERKFR